MILSHRYKFIFIKTNKTAGTSLEIALSKHCGLDDIITPISPDDEQLRASLGYRGPQNFKEPMETPSQTGCNSEPNKAFYNHMPGVEILQKVDEALFGDYFKFCVERNPWDRVVSLYYYKNSQEPRPEFDKFVNSNALKILKARGWDNYHINGKSCVDRVCRYETLAADLEEVRRATGIPEPLILPHAKSGFRKQRRPYRDYYNEATRSLVAELFAAEIDAYGYNF